MSENKDFPIGTVLSIVGDKLISEDHIGGIYAILNFMTGESLMTHQLPRGMRLCRPEILKQHPQLADYDDTPVNGKNWREWLFNQKEKYGATLPISPLPEAEPRFDTPIADLIEMRGGDTDGIIVVEP